MGCELYDGTLTFHPECKKGYSYYYFDCCNRKWWVTWQTFMWTAIFSLCCLCCFFCVRYRMKKKRQKREAEVAYLNAAAEANLHL